ncbi:oligosaccharide flippase family protein [Halorutilales archaeon Cl-col2-1]
MGIARSSLKLFIARATTTVISFIGITYFARELGASQMGVFFLFQTVLVFLGIPAGFGIQGGVEKRISEGKNPDSVFTTSLLMLIISISVISAIILIFQDYLNSYIGGEVAMYIMIGLFLQQMGKLMLKVLNGELRVGDTAIIRFSKKLTWVGAGAVFVLLGFDYYGLVYGVLFGSAVTFIFAWYRKSIPLGKPSIKSARSIFDYSKYSFISSIGGYFYSWMDVAILGIFLSQSHIGAYEMAWRVTTIVMLLSSSIATSISPMLVSGTQRTLIKK